MMLTDLAPHFFVLSIELQPGGVPSRANRSISVPAESAARVPCEAARFTQKHQDEFIVSQKYQQTFGQQPMDLSCLS